jgi:hypothetical protein
MAERLEIVDLVTPLARIADDAAHQLHLHAREQALLDRLRHQRAVIAVTPDAPEERERLEQLARDVRERNLPDTLHDLARAARDHGVDVAVTLVLAATERGDGDDIEVLPVGHPTLALLLDRLEGPAVVPLARGLAALTRWCDPASASAVRRALSLTEWRRDTFLDLVPLGEWIYTEGLGLHLAQALQPALEPHELLGVGKAAFARLREHERALTLLLEGELTSQGRRPWSRWLGGGGRLPSRALNGSMIPVAAGHYLAWRLTAERVQRLGLAVALREEA